MEVKRSSRWRRERPAAGLPAEAEAAATPSTTAQGPGRRRLNLQSGDISEVLPPPAPSAGSKRSKGKGKKRTVSAAEAPVEEDAGREWDLAGARAGPGVGRGSASLAAAPFAAGVCSAYMQRYANDLARLYARPDLPASARWLDSHCHLESILNRTWRGGGKPQVLDNEPLVGLKELMDSWPPGLDGCINNCVFKRPSKIGVASSEYKYLEANLLHFEPGSALSSKLWFTVGLHPHDADNWDDVVERMVRRYAAHPKCIGIGEAGLDFFKHDSGEADKQLRVFRAQAKLAVELGKALVVHARLVSREMEELFRDEMTKLVPSEHPVHMHCYTDSLEHAVALCKQWPRLRIGFTGSITFRDKPKGKGKDKGKGKGKEDQSGEVKKGEAHSRELVQGLPLERFLIETDGPYMCPEPFRGQTAHPGHVHRVAERIAEWQGRPLCDVMAATRQSTAVVYGI